MVKPYKANVKVFGVRKSLRLIEVIKMEPDPIGLVSL